VARLLFWPSIIGTYMNANEAIAAAENRKVHLVNVMMNKKCPVPNLPTAETK
jgi:translation initiation factor IF-3